MVKKEVVVGAEEGLHARPAALFVRKAKSFASEITVVKGENEVNAKSSLKIMTLGAKKDDEITIIARGTDEETAAEALAELITEGEH